MNLTGIRHVPAKVFMLFGVATMEIFLNRAKTHRQ